ncbi:alkene reductase [Caballeronia humi]|uniref:NADH-flavin oxidoreductase/NADH oxidase n=1 Tax=Caballeronia humi TaxID=326474 RepID=A0A158GSR8_9BURK|nr:alkene reductase [Caballeronia humi]SAL34480.1 NADH-flavin oxidoreductase/NADH oxidase [Caballeronia humi]
MSKLFSPMQIGPYTLKHRVVHAPTTRLRANPDDSPSELMREYYSQRASDGGLIITESTHVSYDSRGYLGAPGIYEDSHIAGWKRIADAVHAKGGRIFMQLGHDGRQSHVDLTGGPLPIAPSVVPFEGEALTQDGWVPVSMHRAIDVAEIRTVIGHYRKSAERAFAAGMDGVELHSANGYLADTFLQDGTNKRTDEYGGSIEKRARFLLETVAALVSVWGAERVGVRLSPSGQWGAISDSNPEATFTYAAEQLNRLGLAYLHIIEPRVKGVETIDEGQKPVASELLRKVFDGPIITAGGFNGEGAEEILQKGDADLVAFGRFFASNPDLPYRLRHALPLAHYDRSAFWGGTHLGYTDYPAYREQENAEVC